MKKILFLIMFLSTSAFAHGQFNYYNHHFHGRDQWVGPLIVGGVIGYTISKQQHTQVYNPPLTTIPRVQTQTCTPWFETQNPDGTITRTRTCNTTQ